MHFPRYWARGSFESWTCWGSSDRSLEEAAARGADIARKVAEKFQTNTFASPAAGVSAKDASYGYGNGFLREHVVREVARDGEELTVALTRNAAGCLVLNCAEALFVDIDFPPKKEVSSGGFFKRLFGKSEESPTSASPQEAAFEKIEQYVRRNSLSARIYETKAGLRVLFTDEKYTPSSSEVRYTFEALGADPLYVRLCARQNSFRARVSPKPWRCGYVANPPVSWPFSDANEEKQFAAWLEEYEKAASEYATCKFIKSVGGNRMHRDIGAIQELHDEHCRVNTSLELA